MMRLVTEIRRFRSDQGLRPSQRVAARLVGIDGLPLARHEEAIRSLLRLTPGADGFTASASLEAASPRACLRASAGLGWGRLRARRQPAMREGGGAGSPGLDWLSLAETRSSRVSLWSSLMWVWMSLEK